MKFSIIVPIYNVEKYIDSCVKSLMNQTFKNLEIILVDDGSPDNCPEICDMYARKDKRIKVVHKENGGISDARNVGLLKSIGDYIIFVDADDYIELDFCDKILAYLKNEEVDIIVGDTVKGTNHITINHAKNLTNKKLTGENYLIESFRQNNAPMVVWLNVFRRDFLLDNNLLFKKNILHEDEEFSPRAFLLARSVLYTGIKFYHYIYRENSIMTKKDKRKNAKDLFSTCQEHEKLFNKLHNKQLKKYLLDSLVQKYLSIYYAGSLYLYGREFIHRRFVLKNSKRFKTKLKGILFVISPRFYCWVNKKTKGN